MRGLTVLSSSSQMGRFEFYAGTALQCLSPKKTRPMGRKANRHDLYLPLEAKERTHRSLEGS